MSQQIRILSLDNEPRECGACHACCIAPRIEAAPDYPEEKPSHQRCRHLCDYGRGCTIYAERSQTCQGFRCLWLMGALGVGNRPDKLGLIWTVRTLQDGTPCLTVMELWPGAFDTDLAERFKVELVKDIHLLSVMRADGSCFWWSPDGLDLVERAARLEREASARAEAAAYLREHPELGIDPAAVAP